MKRLRFVRNVQVSVLALALVTPVAAYAQTQPVPGEATDASDKDDGQSGDVVVTGSRIRRSAVEGPAPITILTTEQLRKDGFATVYDALLTVTEATGGVQNDYDWGQSSVNASPLNLRNLGPGRTLLLINGHRVADYPMPYQGKSNFANFANLPSGIVNRTEILSGSASAIYGSDAMGGVVNVILNDKVEGQTARFKYGGATRGGRRVWEASLSGGLSGDRWSLVYNFQHFDRGTLLAKDRPFMDDESDTPYTSRGPAERFFGLGRVNPYTGISLRNRDITAITYVDPPAGSCEKFDDNYYLAERLGYDRNSGAVTRSGHYCAQRVFKDWALRTGSKDTSGYLYGTYDFGGVSAWFSAGVWRTVGGFNTFLLDFNSAVYYDPRSGGGARSIARSFIPSELGGVDAVLTKSKETSVDLSAGLKGKIGSDFNWELFVGRATYNVDESFPVFNQGVMSNFYLGPQQGTFNSPTLGALPVYTPDYNNLWNPLSPSQTAAFSARGLKKAKSELDQAQAVVSGKLFDGWAGPIQAALVLEAGRQSYLLTPDPKTLVADADGWKTPFGNVEQGGGKRNRYAAGLELNIPLLKSLNLSAAGRYDKYDAVSSDAAFTYQLGLEFRPTKALLLRGSYGTSFRAPDMHFVYAKSSKSISDFTDYSACFKAGFPNNQCRREDFLIDNATVSRQGTPDLLYEKGKSWTVGAVWDAFRGFSASIDYWRVDVRNIIDDVSADQVLRDEAYCLYGKTPENTVRTPPPSAALCELQKSRIIRNGAGTVTEIVTGPINRAQTRVSGIDAKVSYQFPRSSVGSFSLSANYTILLDYRQSQFPTDPLVNTVGDQNPKARFNATVNWNKGPANASLYLYAKPGGHNNRWNDCAGFADGFRPSRGNNCVDVDSKSPTFGQATTLLREHRPIRAYINGSVGYQFTSWLKANLYVSNLLGEIYGDEYCGDFAYCIDDPVGREVSAELVIKF